MLQILAAIKPFIAFVRKFWRPIAVIVIVLFGIKCFDSVLRFQFKKGYNAATAKISQDLAQAAKKREQAARAASATYQEHKSDNEEYERSQYVQTTKIVERPVYRNTFIDDDGLRLINSSADRE